MKYSRQQQKINTSQALDIIHEIQINEELYPLISMENHPILSYMWPEHDEYMMSVSEEDLDNWNFMESWEWYDYYIKKHNIDI